ncbi:MAG: hypothetical protein K2P57_00380 [Burkholderiales bacterium]|nr:hypothetical protein [Burkholderiales bacterium]
MNLQNLAYAVDQSAHNLGAVAVTGGAFLALFDEARRKKLAWLVLSGWAIQGATGALFGMLSYAFYGHLPDIAGVAVKALFIKMACAATGFFLAAACIRKSDSWPEAARDRAWLALFLLALTALTSAAFLRWFS